MLANTSDASHSDGALTVNRWRTVRRVAQGGVVFYLLTLLGMMFFEERLVFMPSRYPLGNWEPTGLQFEDAYFQSADGTKLHGWYVPHEKPRAVVLFAPGNGGNLSFWNAELRQLHDVHRLSVMIFDYRGYGRSEGSPNEQGVLADARAARAWLAKRADIAERDIVLIGRSLGGGVMVDLAAADGARGLILESTYTSIPDVAATLYPWAPVRWLMRTRFDSLSKIGRYHGPLLQCHGDCDELIPFEQGERLHAAASGPKRFVRIEGGTHNDMPPAEYYDALEQFIGTLP
jgi:fermentation-respiration switch protein FrsA (DUF1100 family)